MRILTRIALTAFAVLFLAAALAPAEAVCGGNPLIRTAAGPEPDQSFIWSAGQWSEPTYYFSTYYGIPFPPFILDYTAPVPPLTANTQATFWSLGAGNPTLGPGDDAGGWTFAGYPTAKASDATWLYLSFIVDYPGYYYTRSAAEIFTGWGADASIDGCVQNTEIADACTCVLITDHDDTDSYFAIVSDDPDASWNHELSQPGTDGAGNRGPIILQAVPAPTILNAARKSGSFDLDLTVTVPNPTSGIYQGRDGAACACGPVGYKVMQAVVLRGSPPPTDRATDAWSAISLVGGTDQPTLGTAMGSSVAVESLCGSADQDVYLTTQLVFDSAFASPIVSGNGTRIECGPNVADPMSPKVRPSDKRLPTRQPTRARR